MCRSLPVDLALGQQLDSASAVSVVHILQDWKHEEHGVAKKWTRATPCQMTRDANEHQNVQQEETAKNLFESVQLAAARAHARKAPVRSGVAGGLSAAASG